MIVIVTWHIWYLQQVAGLDAIPVSKCCPEGEAVSGTGPGQSVHCQAQAGSAGGAEIEIQAFDKNQPGVAVTRTLTLTGDDKYNLPACSHKESHRIKLSK